MVFTFDKKATGKNIGNDTVEKKSFLEKKIFEIVKKLKSMANISEEFLPTFRFFQFKKSMSFGSSIGDGTSGSIKSADGKVLLTLNDISYKILSDTTKKEADLISLVNTTATQELESPLQQLLQQNNLQAKILFNTLKSMPLNNDMKALLNHAKSLNDD